MGAPAWMTDRQHDAEQQRAEGTRISPPMAASPVATGVGDACCCRYITSTPPQTTHRQQQ